MSRVAMRREDGDHMPARLQCNSGINNKTLSAANAEVWMKEHGVLLLLRHIGRVERLQRVVGMHDYAVPHVRWARARLDRLWP